MYEKTTGGAPAVGLRGVQHLGGHGETEAARLQVCMASAGVKRQKVVVFASGHVLDFEPGVQRARGR